MARAPTRARPCRWIWELALPQCFIRRFCLSHLSEAMSMVASLMTSAPSRPRTLARPANQCALRRRKAPRDDLFFFRDLRRTRRAQPPRPVARLADVRPQLVADAAPIGRRDHARLSISRYPSRTTPAPPKGPVGRMPLCARLRVLAWSVEWLSPSLACLSRTTCACSSPALPISHREEEAVGGREYAGDNALGFLECGNRIVPGAAR